MATRITELDYAYAHVPFTYTDWVAVLDALEGDATDAQRERGQDILQRRAPRPWIAAVEAREEGWQR